MQHYNDHLQNLAKNLKYLSRDMAIEVFPDSPSGRKSPRISFSHDLPQTNVVPIEQRIGSGGPSSSNDFDFCAYRASFDQESSSADELFSGGKILPTEIKRRLISPSGTSYRPPPPPPLRLSQSPPPHECLEITKNKSLSTKTSSPDSEPEEKEQNHKPPFWSFKRSTSLNCTSGYPRRFCPLPVFERSYSTGSAATVKQNISKNPLNIQSERSDSASYASNHHRPPLKKSSNSYGFKVNPVLNIPLAKIFGFCSIVCGGKDKNKKKHQHISTA